MAQHFPVVQPPGASSVPTFGGGTDSADLWLMQLKSYFHLAPNLDSDAKKICFASTRMTDQALMWSLGTFRARLLNFLMNFWNVFLLVSMLTLPVCVCFA